MINIYCITDINNKKYVGSTKQKLKDRLQQHKYNKDNNKKISSTKLDLDNCNIELLEECETCNRKEKERYWINKLDTINDKKLNGRNPMWREENKDKINEWNKKYCKLNYIKNKEIRLKYEKNKYKLLSSWGGDKRYNNNLLMIDKDLFN